MRVVIQRVKKASVTVDRAVKSQINEGMLVLAGFEDSDELEDIAWMSRKIVQLRIFADSQGVMNLSILEKGGDILVVSQFTLHAQTKKGNRPSYIRASKPAVAIPLYESFIKLLETNFQRKVFTGEFGAMMDVELINDGPVTLFSDTKSKE